MSSCDSQGEVFIANDAVYRKIRHAHEYSVLNVLKVLHATKVNGIIPTEICSNNIFFDNQNESRDTLVLKHKKITYISYPHEWCASMLKDAALFHLELSERLFKLDLFIKDAHPWNILFEKGRPIFIDFTSIVSMDSLFYEDYLLTNKQYKNAEPNTRLAWVIKEIFERMYLPYFVNHLYAYAFGKRSRVKFLIEKTTLNASTTMPSILEGLPELRLTVSTITKLLGFLISLANLKKILRGIAHKKHILNFYGEIHDCISKLNVGISNSPYAAYYSSKGEDQNWLYINEWNAKQKNIYKYLNDPEINTVLDVACNTGWFAILAAKLGKHVVAFDTDEACIEILYNQVKKNQLDILPLVLNFTKLTEDRYSIYDGRQLLINASQRLRSDSVIALGIIHHLILGLGLTFKQVLDILITLCNKQLIIEFVDKLDVMIINQPSFFPAYFNNNDLLLKYDINNLIDLIEKHGFTVKRENSHPATRTLLICNRLSM